MIPLIDNIIQLINTAISFRDNQSLCVTCKELSNICRSNITLSSGKKVKYWIDSDNIKLIQFI